MQDESRFTAWLDSRSAHDEAAVPSTQEERTLYLLNDLLERTDWITLEDLSQVLFVSKSQLSRCVRQVEETLSRFDLVLEKRPRYGMRVTGSELNRRMCLASLAVQALSARDACHGGEVPHKVFRAAASHLHGVDAKTMLEDIAACVNESVREADFHINSAAYQNLIVHIAVALIRIQDGYNVPIEDSYLDQARSRTEFSVARAIARRVTARFSVELPEEEIAYIAIHLAGKRSLGSSAEGEGNLVISDEVWGVVTTMLDAVWNAFRFDFRSDLELRMNLARHIVPLSVRLRFNMPLKNPLISDVRARYPLAYSMAMEGAAVLARYYEAELSEDEVGYIAFAFALALERQKTGRPKKHVLVVCASGAGSARLLEYRCRKMFGEEVADIRTCDAISLAGQDLSGIDYVFTTVPLGVTLPVPVLEIKYFLDADEVDEMRGALRSVPVRAQDFPQIDEALLCTHLSFTNKRETLDYLLDAAEEAFPVAGNFRELVWKREAMMATAMGNNVAMPHPIEPACAETRICIGMLDAPVPWDTQGHGVQVVFLMAFALGASTELREMLSALATVLFSPEAVAELVEHQDRETLRRLMAAAQAEDRSG